MVQSSRRPTTPSKTGPDQQLESLTAFNSAAMQVFTQGLQTYTSGLASLNREVMTFVTTRMKHDAELGRALAKCGNWADAATLQQAWAREASEEYLAEAGKLMELTTKLATESWAPLSIKS